MKFLNSIPFLRILFPFIIGITVWLLGYQNTPQLIVSGILFLASIVFYLFSIKKAHTFSKFLFGVSFQVFLFLAGWMLCKFHYEKEGIMHYSKSIKEKSETFMGYISELPVEKTKSIKAEITLQQIKFNGKWENTSGKIIAYFEKKDSAKNIETGNIIVFTGILQEVAPPLNPHEFNYKKYLALKNIYHTVYIQDRNWSVSKNLETVTLFNFTQKIRKSLLHTYRTSGLQNNEFALVAALVLGYDDEIDQPLMNAYSHTGTLHVLSVSGLHVGVIYMLLGYILAFLNRSKKLIWLKVFLILSCLWFFVLLSGFSAPAVRAAFMFSLILVGKTLFENVETANIVFVSAFISLCINPFWLADVGFQLSYIAVLGIIYLYPYFYNMLNFSSGFADKIWALCAVSLAAQLATMPVSLYYFHQFPILFLVTNLVLIPVSTLVMYGGILVLCFCKVAVIAKALVWITAILIKFMNASALFFDRLPFCVIDNIHLSIINMFLLYVLITLVFLSIEQKSFKLLMSSFLLTVVVILISIFFDFQTKQNNELVIYHSDKNAVMGIFSENNYIQLNDTLVDARLESTLRENKIYHDFISEKNIQLTNTCLIIVNHKKILFSKNINFLSQIFIRAVKPDYIWLTGNSLKKIALPTFLCQQKNSIVSGRFYNRKIIACLNNAYQTTKQGAFVLSLSK